MVLSIMIFPPWGNDVIIRSCARCQRSFGSMAKKIFPVPEHGDPVHVPPKLKNSCMQALTNLNTLNLKNPENQSVGAAVG